MTWRELEGMRYRLGGRGANRDDGIDCAGVLERVLIDEGLIAPEEAGPHDVDCETLAGKALGEALASWHSRLTLLGRFPFTCGRVGDFILSDPEGVGVGTHVTVLVQAGASPHVWLTSIRGRGCTRVPERAIIRPLAAYRVAPQAKSR